MAINRVNSTTSISSDSYLSNVVNNVFGSNVITNTRKAYDNLSNFEWQKNTAKTVSDYSKVTSNTVISTTLDKLDKINDYAANLASAASLVDQYISGFMNFATNAGSYLSQGLSILGTGNFTSLLGNITSTLGIDTSKWMEYYNSFKLATNTITDIIANGYSIYNSLRTSFSKIEAISKWNSDDWKTLLKSALYSGVSSFLGEIGLSNLSSCVSYNLYESLYNDLQNGSWNKMSLEDRSTIYTYSADTTTDCMEALLRDILGDTLTDKIKIAEAMITNVASGGGYTKVSYDTYIATITYNSSYFCKGFSNAISSNTNINVSNSLSSNNSVILNLPPTGDNTLDELHKLNIYNNYDNLEDLIDRITNIIENIYGKDRDGSIRDFILNLDNDDKFDTKNPLVAIMDIITACITINSNWNRDSLGKLNYYKLIGSVKLQELFEKYLASRVISNKLEKIKELDMFEDIACTIQFEEPTKLNIVDNLCISNYSKVAF